MVRNALLLSLLLLIPLHAISLQEMRFERRTALVVANAEYPTAPLDQAIAKATKMRDFLTKNGFQVTFITNSEKRTFIKQLREFTAGANDLSTALFYYYGHTVQHDGKNFLIPAHAAIFDDTSLKSEAIPLNIVLKKIAAMQSRTKVIIMDTAFNPTFANNFKPDNKGLTPLKMPSGISIFLPSNPGLPNRSKRFTERFLETVNAKGVSLSQAGNYLKATSKRSTRPWIHIDPDGLFYFRLPN